MSRLPQPADFGALAACADDLAQAFVSLATDIALVIDGHGVVRTVVQDERAPMAPAAQAWVGQPWVETVDDTTRRKIEKLLDDVGRDGVGRRREVNLGGAGGASIPVAYTALRLGRDGPVLAIGRDLRTVSSIQQRFIQTQQETERSYWHQRQEESRQRLLFQVATDAVLTVDGATLRIVEANPAAAALWQRDLAPLAGRLAEQQFDASSWPAVRALLDRARRRGDAGETPARLAGTHVWMSVAAVPLRSEGGMCLLLRVRAAEPTSADAGVVGLPLARLVETATEGVFVTDSAGTIVLANRALAQLLQAAAEPTLQGQPLSAWLGLAAGEVPQLLEQLRRSGIVQGTARRLRLGDAALPDMALQGLLLTEGDQEHFGFTLRPLPSPQPSAPVPATWAQALAHELEGLLHGVGSVSLPALLRQAEGLVRERVVQEALRAAPDSDEAAALQLGLDLPQLMRLRRDPATEIEIP